MLSIGDAVVYRHHVCEVASIREAYYEGRDYYELVALFEKSLKLFVAIEEAKPPALRPVMGKEQALALIDSFDHVETIDGEALASAASTPTLLDRKIKEEYMRRIQTFAPEQLLTVMKFASQRSKMRTDNGRNATATDKKYFTLAHDLLCDELALSLGISREDAPEFLAARIGEPLGV